jgi:hypothetical protein
MEFESFSQAQQDVFVYETLVKPTNYLTGTFLDVGCYEPFEINNTAALERLGWRGLLIDINEEMVQKCREQRKSPAIVGDATAVDWRALCAQYNLGPQIDYLSLDLDDRRWRRSKAARVLKKLHKAGLSFRVITAEHDRYRIGDGARNAMRKILAPQYRLAVPDVTVSGLEYEDWWVKP